MSSPAEIPYLSFIEINRHLNTAIYLQIANQISNAIQRGYLLAGTKLPGTRKLADILAVNRQTIVATFNELEAQGWIETKPNQGTFVLKFQEHILKSTPEEANIATYPSETGFSFKKTNLLDNPFEFFASSLMLDDGIPDIRLTQIRHLSSFYTSNLKRKTNQKRLESFNSEGSEYFKHQLSDYLNHSRGLHIAEQNLLITRSTEMSIYIASQILLSVNDVVLVGDLSYFSVNMIFQKTGAKIATIPIDQDGLDTDIIRQVCEKQKIRMVYVTSHHHYPTTVTLSTQRRLDLLELASKYGFIILEDDYDYEFRYDQAPILPLASADKDGMVIYTGTFGKSLAPGFRTGFIVAPQNLMLEMRKYLGIIDRQGDIMMEHALGEMIEEGEIHRYLKKSIKIYEQRRNACARQLLRLGNEVSFDIPNGGLAFWLRWDSRKNLFALSKNCKEQGLLIPKTLLYQTKKHAGLRLGFGKMNELEMEECISIIQHEANKL